MMANFSETLHESFVRDRRVRVLAEVLADMVPEHEACTILDIGAGDGRLAQALVRHRPMVSIRGIDLFVRADAAIDVDVFDGQHIPLADKSVDYGLLVDVLHHTDDPLILLREARRVCRRGLLLKDHFCQDWLAWSTLRFMDGVGNRRFGVRLPHNYLSPAQWQKAWQITGWRPGKLTERLPLYPFPASLLFTRRLHFVSLLETTSD